MTSSPTVSLEQRITELQPPIDHTEMARRAEQFGSWYAAEAWFAEMKAYLGAVLGVGLLSPLLYLIAFGVSLGLLVDQAQGGNSLGMPYLSFVAPAMLISTAVMAAVSENTYTVTSGFEWKRTYFGSYVTALRPEQIATGHIIGTTARFAVTALLYLVILLAFQAVPLLSGLVLIPIGVLAANAVGLPIMAYAATITEDKGQHALINRFIIAPMLLLSGTFFPLSTLPAFLQPLGWLSPVWHATELGRDVTTSQTEPLWLVAVHLGYLVALTAGGWWLARRNYRRRLSE